MHTLYNSGGIIFLYIPAVFISNISIYILNTKLCFNKSFASKNCCTNLEIVKPKGVIRTSPWQNLTLDLVKFK